MSRLSFTRAILAWRGFTTLLIRTFPTSSIFNHPPGSLSTLLFGSTNLSINRCAHKRLPESFIKSSGFRTPIEVVMAGQELPPYPPEYRSCHMIHGTKRWPTTQKEPFYKKLYRGAVKGLEAFDFIVPVNHPARVSENQMYQDTLGYMMQKVGFDPEDPPTAPKSGGKHFEPGFYFSIKLRYYFRLLIFGFQKYVSSLHLLRPIVTLELLSCPHIFQVRCSLMFFIGMLVFSRELSDT